MIYVDHFQFGMNSPLIQTAPPFLHAIPTVDTAREMVQALKKRERSQIWKGCVMNEQIKSLIEAQKQALDGVGRDLQEAAFDLQRMIDDEDTELTTLSAEDRSGRRKTPTSESLRFRGRSTPYKPL
jgi:hypothetical protein